MDLAGNTFWEFKDSLASNRLRRIAQYDPRIPYSDIKISHTNPFETTAQWHQWLRHTRQDPPSVSEQQYDLQRQSQLKQLAQLADERWASKPSFLDAPKTAAKPGPAMLPRDKGSYVGQTEPAEKEGLRNAVGGVGEVGDIPETSLDKNLKENPWQKSRKGRAGEDWQPGAWTPRPRS
ncbi:MAG: hypothetical protein MMC33_010277 [Icmadophila ericetorum]|nr:hypothetical protein [Icmadophila ericetorum]